ncbi:Zn-dependent protease with chaperone function [Bryocella elongata]|uniref:Zn-dependent protease with chaperone function n=1 Tax=Bryocella elongata TaxID=863522 RepID=A0A1H6BL19_9BACT|nr:M48 family metalloprotease [Bryocella elongata]SEG61390.1 Zn-dependent protease with chaperone function [Bryocella elongata]
MRLRSLLALSLLTVLLSLASFAHAAPTRAESVADAYARAKIAATPLHSNLPDYSLPPASLAKARTLSEIFTPLHFVREAWDLLSLWALLQLGVIAWVRDRAVAFRNRWAQAFLFTFAWMLLITLIDLPLSVFSHHEAVHFGLSVQSWGSWFGLQAKVLTLSYPIYALLLLLLFFLVRRFPRSCWLVCWVLSIPLIAAAFYGTPYANKVMNHYEPLQKTNPALVAKLEELCAKGHMDIPPERMFLEKASEKVTTLNADVEGFGSSKRVVVWDNTIAKATPDEILVIFGHESGHYALGHIEQAFWWSVAGSLALLMALFVGTQWLLKRHGARWRIASMSDWGAFAVFMLIATLLTIVSEPLESHMIRQHEHAADIYGQELVHGIVADPQGAAQGSFQLLGETSYSDPNPNPLYVWWSYDHPPTGYRAAFGKAYDPWARGMEPKYFKKK